MPALIWNTNPWRPGTAGDVRPRACPSDLTSRTAPSTGAGVRALVGLTSRCYHPPSVLDRPASASNMVKGGDEGEESCLWCGDLLRVPDRQTFTAVVCNRCGVAMTLPRPTDEQLEVAYGAWYRPPSGRFSGPGDYILRLSRGHLARRVDRLAPAGGVIDVGAGDGTLVDALLRRGRETLGTERVGTGPFIKGLDIAEVSGDWAAVVFWHSLEHLSHPADALAHAVKLLKPGGLLVIAIPNARSIQTRVFRQDWFGLDMPRHLVHLNERSLRTRLVELGMEVQRVSFTRGGQVFFGWMYGLVRLLPGHPDLYAAVRRPGARANSLRVRNRWLTILAGVLVAPVAFIGAVVEVSVRNGGTLCLEARR